MRPGDIAAAIVIGLFFLPVGFWLVARPIRAVRYFLGERAQGLSQNNSNTVLFLKGLGLFFIVFSLFCICALLWR
jgi:hypothetical protein